MPDDNEWDMAAVTSSQIESVGFNEATKQGRVKFLNGADYLYEGCTFEEYQSIVNAPSAGQQFAATWRTGRVYRRIG